MLLFNLRKRNTPLTANLATIKKLGQMLMMDEIDINDKILIQDTKSDLNLVGAIKRQGDMLDLVIITVMREKNFRNTQGTKTIKI